MNGNRLTPRLRKVFWGERDIIDQYIEYTGIFDEQVRTHGYTEEAAYGIVQTCIERGIMAEYFSQREARSVVFDYMDNVRALELKIEDERRDAERAGEQRGRAEGRAEEREAAVKSLIEKMGWTAQQAKEALGY